MSREKKAARAARKREQLKRRLTEEAFEAISQAATLEELSHPHMVAGSSTRIARIAQGSGQSRTDVRFMFKELAHAGVAPPPRVFYEMKAASLALAYERNFGRPVTAEMVLSAMREAYDTQPEGTLEGEDTMRLRRKRKGCTMRTCKGKCPYVGTGIQTTPKDGKLIHGTVIAHYFEKGEKLFAQFEDGFAVCDISEVRELPDSEKHIFTQGEEGDKAVT